jgi:hypothetical protein
VHCVVRRLAATVMAQVEHLRYEVLSDFVAALKRNVSQSQATVLSSVLAVLAALLEHSSPGARPEALGHRRRAARRRAKATWLRLEGAGAAAVLRPGARRGKLA